jgi:hypothetical protein
LQPQQYGRKINITFERQGFTVSQVVHDYGMCVSPSPTSRCIFTIDLPRVAFSLSAIVSQGVALAG